MTKFERYDLRIFCCSGVSDTPEQQKMITFMTISPWFWFCCYVCCVEALNTLVGPIGTGQQDWQGFWSWIRTIWRFYEHQCSGSHCRRESSRPTPQCWEGQTSARQKWKEATLRKESIRTYIRRWTHIKIRITVASWRILNLGMVAFFPRFVAWSIGGNSFSIRPFGMLEMRKHVCACTSVRISHLLEKTQFGRSQMCVLKWRFSSKIISKNVTRALEDFLSFLSFRVKTHLLKEYSCQNKLEI